MFSIFISTFLLLTFLKPGFSLYFPQERIQIAQFGPDTKIKLVAILDPDESGRVSYQLSLPTTDTCPHLDLDQDRGLLSNPLNKEILSDETCTYLVTGSLEGQVGLRKKAEARLSLILSRGTNQCSNEEICWNGAKSITIQAMENSEELSTPLGYATRCGRGMQVAYNVTIHPNYDVLQVGGGVPGISTSSLRIKSMLDREFRDEYSFNVTCTLKERDGGKIQTIVLPGTLTILDQNDNPPSTQEGSQRANVSISLKNIHNRYEPHQRLIQEYPQDWLFKDLDTVSTNRFQMTLLDDLKGLLNMTFITTEIRIPGGTKPPYTVIRPTINLSSRIHEIHPWRGLYCVLASFQDLALIPSLRNRSTMEYRICIHWMTEDSTAFLNEIEDYASKSNNNVSTMGDVVPFSSIVSPARDPIGCDEVCLIVSSAGGTAVCLLLLASFYAFKSRVSDKNKGRGTNLLGSGTGEGSGDHAGTTMMILSSEMDNIRPQGNRHLAHVQANDAEFTIDSKWEISRKSLILEDSIGTGQFGQVYKARTDGVPGREGTFVHVAVKMLKDNQTMSGKSCRQEFCQEFSFLQQLDHPNVIKVLGACTTPGGPLYLVMEYAEFGSLRSFLRKCRRVESLQLGTNVESEFSGSTLPSTPNPVEQKDFVVNSNEILQFSWQIAKGMAYLSDMKMVHRDLAARNILLTRNKVCKISDFGLTRDIYVDEAYQKKSVGLVPVKWLAPESMADGVYTKKSDVWSYGILLWELAMLGASPYPGVPNEELYSLLKAGYRMPPPANTSSEFYSLMRQCWALDPGNRPSFHLLGASLGKLLEEGIEYLKLDLPQVFNPGYDYFSSPMEELHPLTYESQQASPGPLIPHTYMNSINSEDCQREWGAYEVPRAPQLMQGS